MEYASFLRRHIEHLVPLSEEAFEIVLNGFIPVSLSKKEYLIKVGQKVSAPFLGKEGIGRVCGYPEKSAFFTSEFCQREIRIVVRPVPAIIAAGTEENDRSLPGCIQGDA
jgi:hypothetical protein